MTCPGTIQALQAGEENPRCLRCDRILPEHHRGDPLDCGCDYAIKPSPLSGRELLVITDDAEAERLLRSLGARFARAHGWFINPTRAKWFEELWKAEALYIRCGKYRFPNGAIMDIYAALKHLRGK